MKELQSRAAAVGLMVKRVNEYYAVVKYEPKKLASVNGRVCLTIEELKRVLASTEG